LLIIVDENLIEYLNNHNAKNAPQAVKDEKELKLKLSQLKHIFRNSLETDIEFYFRNFKRMLLP
jgi:hypothetical protein